ncbi:YdgA family protein [Diaphorobacter caeni]|nr:YdgA family protein [Diaphorobacter caeni]
MKKALIALGVIALIAAVGVGIFVSTFCSGHPHGMC